MSTNRPQLGGELGVPQPLRCPECGGLVVVDMQATHRGKTVYGLAYGGVWLGEWDPDEEEWYMDCHPHCGDCDWEPDDTPDEMAWEIGTPPQTGRADG